MWTQFMDMHSGGESKEDFQYLYIEAPKSEAVIIFYNRFKHSPYRVTCTCCGEDYSISEWKDLLQATGYERGCEFENGEYIEEMANRFTNKYLTIDEYMSEGEAKFIFAKDILPEEKIGEVPEQGYVWMD